MRLLQAQVMLSINHSLSLWRGCRASTCVEVSSEISIEKKDKGKNINTVVSPAPVYTGSVWGRHSAVYA